MDPLLKKLYIERVDEKTFICHTANTLPNNKQNITEIDTMEDFDNCLNNLSTSIDNYCIDKNLYTPEIDINKLNMKEKTDFIKIHIFDDINFVLKPDKYPKQRPYDLIERDIPSELYLSNVVLIPEKVIGRGNGVVISYVSKDGKYKIALKVSERMSRDEPSR